MTSTAMGQRVDIEKLRVALRCLSRSNLLSVANRAIELVPRPKLSALVAGIVRLELQTEGTRSASSLLDEVRTFHDACLRGEYYDSFDVNSKNYTDTSKGTDASWRNSRVSSRNASVRQRRVHHPPFVRPLSCSSHCSGVSTEILTASRSSPTRAAHGKWVLTGELLCRRTSGASPTVPAELFAREVDRVIGDFADYDRPKHLAAARRVANAEQRGRFGLYLPVSRSDHDGPEQPSRDINGLG